MKSEEGVRIDKWLWAARLYKSRSLAGDAVASGHVQVNGVRVKPSRLLSGGEMLSIRMEGFARQVRVLALAVRRGPAREAATLYEETEESLRAAEEARESARLRRLEGTLPTRRPTKKDRRKIIRFKNGLE